MNYAIAFYSHDEAGFVGLETFETYEAADLVFEDWCEQRPHAAMMNILPVSECVKIKRPQWIVN